MANTTLTNGLGQMTIEPAKVAQQSEIVFTPAATSTPPGHHSLTRQWTRGVCPNCGFTKADVDPNGVTWCPACGYSQKGCYT